MNKQLRVMVVDDSAVFRSVIINCVNKIPISRVISYAIDGQSGIAKAIDTQPDIVTLDIEMPDMNGIEVLKILQKKVPSARIIMVSNQTKNGARFTMSALTHGAFGFIAKPDSKDQETNIKYITDQLSMMFHEIISSQAPQPLVKKVSVPISSRNDNPVSKIQIVAIGSSTGGPKALHEIIPFLPKNFPVPIVIVQHMPPLFTASLAETLQSKSQLTVIEAQHNSLVQRGIVYIAPGGHHMSIVGKNPSDARIAINDDPPENFCRPAVDYLFRSIAKIYKSNVCAVILSGMGKDGTLGLKVLKSFGAYSIGQDEATSTVYGMPKEAKLAGCIDLELPITKIAQQIIKIVQ